MYILKKASLANPAAYLAWSMESWRRLHEICFLEYWEIIPRGSGVELDIEPSSQFFTLALVAPPMSRGFFQLFIQNPKTFQIAKFYLCMLHQRFLQIVSCALSLLRFKIHWILNQRAKRYGKAHLVRVPLRKCFWLCGTSLGQNKVQDFHDPSSMLGVQFPDVLRHGLLRRSDKTLFFLSIADFYSFPNNSRSITW